MILAIDGLDASATALEFVLTRFQPNRTSGKGGRVPMHVRVIHVMAPSPSALDFPGIEGGQPQSNRPERAEVDHGWIYEAEAAVSAWKPLLKRS